MKALSKKLMFLTLMTISGFVQAQETYFATVKTADHNTAFIDFDAYTELKTWDKDYLQVFVFVNAEDVKDHIKHELYKDGRYKIDVQRNEFGHMFLSMPNLRKIIHVNGKCLSEKIKIRVLAPMDLDVEFDSENNLVAEFIEPFPTLTKSDLIPFDYSKAY